MPSEITLDARAKLNLTLDILGLRADGYHEIETVMQSVTLCDTVRLTRRAVRGIELVCSEPTLPVGPGNLAHRAAAAFLHAAGREDAGIRIELLKRIPSGAGMAGGSADAAAVLVGLDRLLGTDFSAEELAALGTALGADVPFCLTGGTWLARGIGERLAPAPGLPDCWIVTAKPAASVSTAAAYAAFDRLAAPVRPNTAAMQAALGAGDLLAVAESLGNVFEQAGVPPEVPALRAAMVRAGALGACMTGSGSAVFGLFDGEAPARACAAGLTAGAAVFVCRSASAGWVIRSSR